MDHFDREQMLVMQLKRPGFWRRFRNVPRVRTDPAAIVFVLLFAITVITCGPGLVAYAVSQLKADPYWGVILRGNNNSQHGIVAEELNSGEMHLNDPFVSQTENDPTNLAIDLPWEKKLRSMEAK